MSHEPRKEVVLIVELEDHYCEQFHMFHVGHPKPPDCRFVGRYEYSLCDVVVYARNTYHCHPATARRIADHYHDQFLSVRDDSTYVNRDFFS